MGSVGAVCGAMRLLRGAANSHDPNAQHDHQVWQDRRRNTATLATKTSTAVPGGAARNVRKPRMVADNALSAVLARVLPGSQTCERNARPPGHEPNSNTRTCQLFLGFQGLRSAQ